MRRILGILLTFVLLLTACGQNAQATWQEQYELGVRYLSEGNYEEAIIAFTAAIEIDPKRPEAYLKAAEAYEGMGDRDAARAILEQGYQATGDETLRSIQEESEPVPTDDDILSHAVDFGSDSLYIEHEYVFEGPIPASEDFLLFGEYDFMTMDTAAVLQLFPNASGPADGSLYSGDDKIEIPTTVCHEYVDVYIEIENTAVQSSASIMRSNQYVGYPYLRSLVFGDRDYLLDGHETGVYGLVLGMSYADVMEHLGFSKEGADVLSPFRGITIDSIYVSFREISYVSDVYRSLYLYFRFSEDIGYSVQLHFGADDLLNEVIYSRYDEE